MQRGTYDIFPNTKEGRAARAASVADHERKKEEEGRRFADHLLSFDRLSDRMGRISLREEAGTVEAWRRGFWGRIFEMIDEREHGK